MTTLRILTFCLAVLSSSLLYSQMPPPPPGSDNPAPFGFVELLIGAGAVYGASKTYTKKREK